MKIKRFMLIASLSFFLPLLPAAQTGGASGASGSSSSPGTTGAIPGAKSKSSSPALSAPKKSSPASQQANSAMESQTGSLLEKKAGAKASDTIQNAVRNDEFTLQNGKEYKLDKSVNLADTSNKADDVTVDYQVGVIRDKPAYVTVVVDSKDAPQKADDAEKLFGTRLDGSVHTAEAQTSMLACAGERICVETQKIDNQEVCVKWRCVGK
jgi:hypothetical protein